MNQPNIEAIYPLTPLQQGMLFHAISAPGSGEYVNQVHITLPELHVAAFKQAWQQAVDRHAILRTLFVWENRPQPLQVVRKAITLRFTECDFRELPEPAQRDALSALLQAERRQDFVLAEAPLMRLQLVRRTETTYVLVWTYHHLITDGWSLANLFKEVFALYEAARQGTRLALPPPRPFADYIGWLQRQDRGAAESFWRRYLEGFSAPTPLVLDAQGAPAVDAAPFHAEHGVLLPQALLADLRGVAREHQLTLNTLYMGAWGLLLSRYSGEPEVLFGTVVSGRPPSLSGIESMIGVFINTLPLRIRIDEAASLEVWLRQLQAQQVEREKFGHVSLVDIQKWSPLQAGTRLFECVAAFENYPIEVAPQTRVEHLEIGAVDQTNLPLELLILLEPETTFKLCYDPQRFTAETIGQLGRHYQTILQSMAAGLGQRLGDVQVLPVGEQQELLIALNATASPYPRDATLSALFEAQVQRSPDAVAVLYGDTRLTYDELNARANRLARLLAQHGVRPPAEASESPRVALCVERSPDLIVGMLAIIKAGAAYVPLDPDHPPERLAFLLADTGAPVVLTHGRLRARLPHTDAQLIALDEVDLSIYGSDNPDVAALPTQTAYVIYTSGSTGTPKGVMVPQRAVIRLVVQTDYVKLSAVDRIAQASNAAFDAATFEIWGALLHGAQLVGIARDELLHPPQLAAALRERGISILFLTTALFNQVVRLHPEAFGSLRCLLFGGEAVDPEPVRQVLRHGRPAHFLHVYGPTENTTFSLWHEITALHEAARTVPIGLPIASSQAYLLDAQRRPIPIGAPGELYLGGDGLAQGYLNRRELTAEKFVRHALMPGSPPTVLYKTGDVARFVRAAAGTGTRGVTLEFIGRIDNQIKLRGFRIELGEIEAVLGQHAAVREAAVVVSEQRSQKCLVAHIVPRPQHLQVPAALSAELRDYMQQKLPDYMVPAAFVLREALPLTVNGKIDRRLLAAQAIDYLPSQEFTAAQTETERSLAELWREVLRVPQVGVHDNFFELGGDSILSMQLVSRARKAGLHLSPKQIFQHPTVAGLAQVVQVSAATAPPPQGATVGTVALTPIQRWFFAQRPVEVHHFNQSSFVEVAADVSPGLLRQALHLLIAHHDALRLRFRRASALWEQLCAPVSEMPLPVFELAELPKAEQSAFIAARTAELQRSLHIEAGPLIAAALFRFAAGRPACLYIVIHHLAVDGVSWRILLEDLQMAYAQLQSGQAPQLPAKTTSFQRWADFLVQQGVGRVATQLSGWTSHLAATPLPMDWNRGANSIGSAQQVVRTLSREQTSALVHDAAAAYRTQINDLLLTALLLAVTEWTGESSVQLALEGHGRQELDSGLDLSRTVGWFTSIHPVRLTLPSRSAGEAIKSLKEQLRRIPSGGIGYGILRYLAESPALVQAAEPQLSFNYMGQFDQLQSSGIIQGAADFPSSPDIGAQNLRTYVLEMTGIVTGGRLEMGLTYSDSFHARSTMERLLDRYMDALTGLIAHCRALAAVEYTPSDFPQSKLDQTGLDSALVAIARANRGHKIGAPLIEAIYPLAPSQQGMLLESLAFPESGRQIEQFLWQWQGELELVAYERAWHKVLTRHAILRTGFLWQDQAEPLQFVLRHSQLPLLVQDWRALSAIEQSKQLESFLSADRQQGFNLSQVPLMRLVLFQIAERRFQAVWSTHHILLDGWGLPIVLSEVHSCYQAECTGQTLQLPATRPYGDYIDWLQRQDQAAAERFWRDRLRGVALSTPIAPVQAPKDDAEAGFAEHCVSLPSAVLGELRAVARQLQVTQSTVMQGVWGLLLGRYSGAAEVLFGITVSGRPAELAQAETMVGLFINTVPLRLQLAPTAHLGDWLRQLQAQTLEQQPYEHCAAGQIQQWSEVPAALPLFESLLVFENYPLTAASQTDQGFAVVDVRSIGAQTQYPLTLTVFPHDGLHIKLVYNRAVFAAADIERIAGHLQVLLGVVLRSAHEPLASILAAIPAEQVPAVASAPRRTAGTASRLFVPPLNPIEQELVQIWQTLFGLPSVSTQDNFYDLGGHSLMAIRLVGQIRHHFDIQIPISALLLNPTIAELAQRISELKKGQRSQVLFSPLVAIQTGGKRPPFFLAPGAGGTVFYMYYMARYMEPEQPFYGLQASGLDGQTSAHTSVEAMAAHFLEAIRQVQPRGPYYLGGHSFGAFIAYEMAQRLLRAGEEVGCLILFDTEASHLVKRLQHETPEQWIKEYVTTFEEVLADKISVPYEPPATVDSEAHWSRFASWLRANHILASTEETDAARHLLEVFKLQLQMDYRPRDFIPMRATLFRATDWEVDNRAEKMGWDALAVEPEIELVPGNHMTFIGEPHVQVVAAKLSACLRRAQAGGPGSIEETVSPMREDGSAMSTAPS